MKSDNSYKFKKLSKLWKRFKDKKVDYLYKHQDGGLFYSKSYCDYFKGSVKKISESFLKKIEYTKIIAQNTKDVKGHDARFTSLLSQVENHTLYIFHQAIKNNQCYYDITGIAHSAEFESLFKEAVGGIEI